MYVFERERALKIDSVFGRTLSVQHRPVYSFLTTKKIKFLLRIWYINNYFIHLTMYCNWAAIELKII